MIVDFSPAGHGKTTRMIEWLRQADGRVLAVFSAQEENRLRKLYPDVSGKIFYYGDVVRGSRYNSRSDDELAIDNADMTLSQIFRERIKRVSLTKNVAETPL